MVRVPVHSRLKAELVHLAPRHLLQLHLLLLHRRRSHKLLQVQAAALSRRRALRTALQTMA